MWGGSQTRCPPWRLCEDGHFLSPCGEERRMLTGQCKPHAEPGIKGARGLSSAPRLGGCGVGPSARPRAGPGPHRPVRAERADGVEAPGSKS